MDFNLQIEMLKRNLIKSISDSELPIGVVHYIVKDILQDLTETYDEYLNEAYKKLQEENQKEEE